ncbi:MAG: inorganic phosphate transporter [Chloroflexota bacterium]|nr:inorganic phosphate transporter [Chloroflexota bacterium]
MPDPFVLLIVVIAAAIGFAIANGFNDAANAIATVIGTRTLSPRAAIIMAAFFNFLGAATGTAVAMTIAKGIIAPEDLTMNIILAGTAAIIIWAIIATRYGMPISLTHGLVAGLVGAGIATSGTEIIVWGVLTRVISAVGIAPILGFGGGFLVMVAILWLFRRAAPEKIRGVFIHLQVLSAAFMAYSHGKNDGQMPIGLISMALMAYYGHGELHIPFWAVVVSAASISLGTAIGGRRVIETLGLKVTTLRPVHGFAAEISAATVIELASHLGIPVSTTHCISTAIMGVGATRRLSAVRWGIARSIVLTWILTFPACGLLSWIIASILKIAF